MIVLWEIEWELADPEWWQLEVSYNSNPFVPIDSVAGNARGGGWDAIGNEGNTCVLRITGLNALLEPVTLSALSNLITLSGT
jgi:hypothetical protein